MNTKNYYVAKTMHNSDLSFKKHLNPSVFSSIKKPLR